MYRSDVIDTLGEVLSIAYHHKYATSVIESRIAHSPFFIAVEQNIDSPTLPPPPTTLLNSIFYHLHVHGKIELFNHTSRPAELHLRIHDTTP
ncbi:MAG: hypothetical protein MJ199_01695, partial [Bacilli bacterium]|nr:hypothetical protein [Bacilli bacterium]